MQGCGPFVSTPLALGSAEYRYHIDGALAGVPMEERCEHKPRSMAEKKEWASRPKPEGESKSLWERLFG